MQLFSLLSFCNLFCPEMQTRVRADLLSQLISRYTKWSSENAGRDFCERDKIDFIESLAIALYKNDFSPIFLKRILAYVEALHFLDPASPKYKVALLLKEVLYTAVGFVFMEVSEPGSYCSFVAQIENAEKSGANINQHKAKYLAANSILIAMLNAKNCGFIAFFSMLDRGKNSDNSQRLGFQVNFPLIMHNLFNVLLEFIMNKLSSDQKKLELLEVCVGCVSNFRGRVYHPYIITVTRIKSSLHKILHNLRENLFQKTSSVTGRLQGVEDSLKILTRILIVPNITFSNRCAICENPVVINQLIIPEHPEVVFHGACLKRLGGTTIWNEQYLYRDHCVVSSVRRAATTCPLCQIGHPESNLHIKFDPYHILGAILPARSPTVSLPAIAAPTRVELRPLTSRERAGVSFLPKI